MDRFGGMAALLTVAALGCGDGEAMPADMDADAREGCVVEPGAYAVEAEELGGDCGAYGLREWTVDVVLDGGSGSGEGCRWASADPGGFAGGGGLCRARISRSCGSAYESGAGLFVARPDGVWVGEYEMAVGQEGDPGHCAGTYRITLRPR